MMSLNPFSIEASVRAALEEDLGRAGDITSQAVIPSGTTARAVIAARQKGIVSGLPLAAAAFQLIDPQLSFEPLIEEGTCVEPGSIAARISGPARSLLSAERVALNYLGRMSGIATLTARYVAAVAHTKARICCTRKTSPGLRVFEKYAVRCGGGFNHRFGLDDAFLIKDNHIAVAGGIVPALRAAKVQAGHLLKIEIEVDTLDQLDAVLREGADVVLLDNMNLDELREAVKRVAGRMIVEASGRVDLTSLREIAETGVDVISSGALTHSAPVFDWGLDVEVR